MPLTQKEALELVRQVCAQRDRGNIVFEDVVFLCERMGFATNIDVEALNKARLIAEQSMPSETFYGNVSRAGVPKNITWAG